MTQPDVSPVIIVAQIAKPVKKHPVDFVSFQRLGQNLDHLLPVVAPVDADAVQAVVIEEGIAILPTIEPLYFFQRVLHLRSTLSFCL